MVEQPLASPRSAEHTIQLKKETIRAENIQQGSLFITWRRNRKIIFVGSEYYVQNQSELYGKAQVLIWQNRGRFRPLKTVKTASDCQVCCRLSIQLQTVKTVADCQDNFTQLQTVQTIADSCRQLQTVVDHCRQLHIIADMSVFVCSVRWRVSYLPKGWRHDHGLPFRQRPWFKTNNASSLRTQF